MTRWATPLLWLALVAGWEALARGLALPAWLLPAPSAILAMGWDWRGELLLNAWVTLRETVLGFALALALSVPLALAVAFTALGRSVLHPLLLGLQSVPKVALAPLITLWFGIGEWPKIVVVVLVCFFPILVNLVAGFAAPPPAMLDLLRAMRAGRWTVFRRLRLPVALPFLFTGCKVAVTFAVIGAVIAEFVAAQQGLGYLILMSSAQSQTPLAFAALLVLTLVSVLLFHGIEALERRVVSWRG